MMNDKKKPGFEPDPSPWQKPCSHHEHRPPGHIVIPEGMQYRHVCPACGKEIVLRRPRITLEA